MLEYLIFILGVVGCTFIVTQSYIFYGIRNYVSKKSDKLGKLINCPMCFGFWVSLFFFITYSNFFVYLLVVSCGSSFICYASYLMLRRLMDKYD